MFKNMKFPLKILNKKKFILCFIDAFLENLCLYLMPVVLSFFTTQPFTLEKLEHLIIAVIVLKIIEIILHHFWLMYILKFEDIYSKDLQLAYFNRVAKMSPYKLNNMHNGFLKKQIDIIADGAANLMESSFETINGFIISIAIFLIEVINQDFKMFWFCLAIIIGIVIYNIWLGRRFIVAQEEYNKSYSKYNSTYVDFLQNIKILKRLSAVKYANSKNEKAFEDVVPKLNRVNICYSLRANVINFVLYFMYVVILINLYFKMKSGDEILSYLLFYATMFSGLNTELRALSKLFMNYNKFQAATNQAENIIGDNVEKDIIYDWKKIQIKDLEFKYDDEAKAPIKIPLFEINRGDKISIVGKSGQGKTTFLNIFSRYIEIDENNYIIDGEKKDGSPDISYISQESDLFDLSIRENLALGKNISDEDIINILSEAGLKEWIDKLENGLDTVVGDRGIKLSVGQKQRLNVIRGILLDKDVYILDEPTSNLDKETEKIIIALIQKHLKDKTVIIVTHRDEIRTICNKHYEFIDNTISECEFSKI